MVNLAELDALGQAIRDHEIGALQQLVERHQLDVGRRPGTLGQERVVGDHLHAESVAAPRNEAADVTETDMQYLYSDNTGWNFMDPQTYEQVIAESAAMGGTERWIKEEDVCTLTLWNGRPILVTAPNFVDLEVTETDSRATRPAPIRTRM